MSEDAIRGALAGLARNPNADAGIENCSGATDQSYSFRETIERATVAVDDIEEAAEFVTDVGLDELEHAVDRADCAVSACADDGHRALDTFRAFRIAAQSDHFHSGRGTSLGGDDVAQRK